MAFRSSLGYILRCFLPFLKVQIMFRIIMPRLLILSKAWYFKEVVLWSNCSESKNLTPHSKCIHVCTCSTLKLSKWVRVLYGTGYPFIWSSARTRGYETHTSCRAFGNGALTSWSVATGDRTPISCMQGEHSTKWTIADIHVHVMINLSSIYM